MPSTKVASMEQQFFHSESDASENFEQEIANVSQDEEDRPNDTNGLAKEAIALLESRWQMWKDAEKGKKKTVWKTLKRDLKALPCHKGVRGDEWKLKANTYHKWLQNKGRVRPNRRGFNLGRKWSGRRVLEDRYKQQVIDRVKERNEGTYCIESYQPTLKEVLDEVPPEEQAEAELVAEEWNNTGGPGEVQTRFTKKTMYTVVKRFAEEMWKKGGIRMVILSGWKDDDSGEIFSHVNDFNAEIGNGPKFDRADRIQPHFDHYLRRCFGSDDQGSGDEDPQSEGDEQAPEGVKAVGKRKGDREDHVHKVVAADGSIHLPEFNRGDRMEMLSLIRGFLTAHYRKACGNPKATVPFTKLSEFHPEQDIVDRTHVPFGWTIPRDPSKTLKRDAWDFLSHIQERQEEHGEGAFRFKKWLDAGGHLQLNVEDPEFNPAAVTKCPRPRPRPRIKPRKAPSSSESEAESSEISDGSGEVGRSPEQGPLKVKGGERLGSEESDDSECSEDDAGGHPVRPDPKGKGKEVLRLHNTHPNSKPRKRIWEYEQDEELEYREQQRTAVDEGYPKPTNKLMKSDPKKNIPPLLNGGHNSDRRLHRHSIYSDDSDDVDADNIQKSLGDAQPSEDGREDSGRAANPGETAQKRNAHQGAQAFASGRQ